MDEGWGNIIYLIVLVLFGVFGALKKKKPIAVSPPDDGNPNNIPSSPEKRPITNFDSVLDALLGQETTPVYHQEQEVDLAVPHAEKEVKLDSVSEAYNLKKSSIEYSDQDKKSGFADLDYMKETEDIEDEDLEDIDWRKAIIYKEILDRKYN